MTTEPEQAQADYAMLRAVARRCFAEDADDQTMRDLWNLAASDDHPGVALTIRYNRLKAVLDAARKWAAHDDVLAAAIRSFDGPITEATGGAGGGAEG